MWKCSDCHKRFNNQDVIEIKTSYEDYYGISTLFPNKTPLNMLLCPFCESDNIEEIRFEEVYEIDDDYGVKNLSRKGKK